MSFFIKTLDDEFIKSVFEVFVCVIVCQFKYLIFLCTLNSSSFCSCLIGIGPGHGGAGLDGFLGNEVLSTPALTG